jgi:hypothetical protein
VCESLGGGGAKESELTLVIVTTLSGKGAEVDEEQQKISRLAEQFAAN